MVANVRLRASAIRLSVEMEGAFLESLYVCGSE